VHTAIVTVAKARLGDDVLVSQLLREAALPYGDIKERLGSFLVARDEHAVMVGAIGAEIHGTDALLRSLVVAPSARGRGIAGQLIAQLEAEARGAGVARWWLLTTTAPRFFERRGFIRVPRQDAPTAIQRTEQFSGGCSCDAICLTRSVGPAEKI
jgi:amino-acid N-acetyltransferase